MRWQQEKQWSDRFITEITGILGQQLIGPAPEEDDALRNSDLMVLKMEAVRIGCRIRRNKYAAQYKNQFTIRYSLKSGRKTEFAKIVEGWGDYFFYGFSDPQECHLESYRLCDLKVFRLEIARRWNTGAKPWDRLIWNFDQSSQFAVFNFDRFEGTRLVVDGSIS